MEYILVCPLTLVNFVGSLVLLFSKQKLRVWDCRGRRSVGSRMCVCGGGDIATGGQWVRPEEAVARRRGRRCQRRCDRQLHIGMIVTKEGAEGHPITQHGGQIL
jgi:hypothetical protein